MEKTRYFRSSNQLNVAINLLSGNLFPLGDGDRGLSFVAILWIMCIWWVKLTYFGTGLLGTYFTNLTTEEILKKSGPVGVHAVEVIIPTIYLHLRRKAFNELVNEYNLVLIDSDDLRRCVHDTLEPYRKGLTLYMYACFGAASACSAAPIFKMRNNDHFYCEDLTIPAYIPGAPFDRYEFIAAVTFQVVGHCTLHLSKISVDFYIIHFIAVLAAQYKFVGEQLSRALSDEDKGRDNLSVVATLHQCIRYHTATIQIGRRLSKLLSLFIGSTYFTCILKFCFLAYGVVRFGSANIEKVAYIVYVLACIVQVFLLCSSIENLLIESTSVTEDAFHENWHARSYAVKQIFCTMEVTNQMECRLSAYGIVDLVVPTLALILSKSYSVCLLVLEMN